MRDLRVGRAVTVVAPPAISGVRDLESLRAHSPGEYAQELEKRQAILEQEIQRLRVAMDTFTNIIATFVKVATDQYGGKGEEVMLPRSVIDRMDGSKVTISEAPGTRDVLVRIREGAPHPIWEGRHG